MIETTENPEDVEKLLVDARAKLQAFEDGVDRARLLKRLKTQSPAHPVLLFRALFLFLAGLGVVFALAVMIVPVLPQVDPDLARSLAKFDAVVPAPAGVPGLPALAGVVVICMLVGWVMTTFAAYAMGRDAQMLPWEQKQHQKLVNEVTRLTTQKAVMERIRGTPAGARPRIATPVPVSLRDRGSVATPQAAGRAATGGSALASGRRQGGFGPPPGETPAGQPQQGTWTPPPRPGGGGGVLSRARSGESAPPSSSTGGLRGPAPPRIAGSGGPGNLGGSSGPTAAARPVPGGFGGAMGPSAPGFASAGTSGGFGGTPPSSGDNGAQGGFGAASPGPLSSGGSGGAEPAGIRLGSTSPGVRVGGAPPGPSLGGGAAARGGTPLGAVPKPGQSLSGASASGRLAPPLGFPGTPEGAHRNEAVAPAPAAGQSFGEPSPQGGIMSRARGPGAAGVKVAIRAPETMPDLPDDEEEGLGDIVEIAPGSSSAPAEAPQAPQAQGETKMPRWGRIEEPWLEEALEKAESIAKTFPVQAHLEFSQETHLPFTLVIARATPAMAFRAMVTYVEFLAGILTPPRARIELSNVAHLDHTFHRNVTAALEPYFGDRFEVEPEPGRVEIIFKDPDPSWQTYPVLPMES